MASADWKVKIELDINDLRSELSGLEKEINGLTKEKHKIELGFDTKTLDSAIKKLDNMLDNIGKGTGDFKQFEKLDQEITSAATSIKELQKAFGTLGNESGAKSLLSSIQNIDTSLTNLSSNLSEINRELINTSDNTTDITVKLSSIQTAFSGIESSLSSMRKVFSDVGDGEEFSPLLNTINEVKNEINGLQSSIKGIGLNLNIDFGSDSEMEANVQSKISNALQAYQRLYEHLRTSSGGKVAAKSFLDFDIDQFTTSESKLQAYRKFIEKTRNEVKLRSGGKDRLKLESDSKYWNEAAAAMGQVTKASNEMKSSRDTSSLDGLFGKTDLTEVIGQLELITEKLQEISTVATNLSTKFDSGFNVITSVEEITKLTEKVKILEDELNQLKTASVNQSSSIPSTESADLNKVQQAAQEAATAKESFVSANEKVASSVDISVSKLQEEANLFKQVAENAKSASENKKAFASANENVADSGKKTSDEGTSGKTKSSSSVGEYTENVKDNFKTIMSLAKSANTDATESIEKWKLLSQQGKVGEKSFSAKLQKNNGQTEDWYFKKNDKGTYDVKKYLSTDYAGFEKEIISAENKLRDLQRIKQEIVSKSPNASTFGIDAQISAQQEYVDLLDKTAQYLRTNNETLLKGQQIETARNKAAQEYSLNQGTKDDVKNANALAKAEESRAKNIEQSNRLLNRYQIRTDAIEATYTKVSGKDRYVSNASDLSELSRKKSDIQSLISKLNNQGRNSSNEQEYLQLEKLIAEYQRLAQEKLKANNPSQQKLGGTDLAVAISEQVKQYNDLIAKSEKYGDSTKDITEELKAQRDLIAEKDQNGVYVARKKKTDGSEFNADDYYSARDNYKIKRSEFGSYENAQKEQEKENKYLSDKSKASYEKEAKLEEEIYNLRKKNIGAKKSEVAKNNELIKGKKKEIEQEQEYRKASGLDDKNEEAKNQLINKRTSLMKDLDTAQNAYNKSLRVEDQEAKSKFKEKAKESSNKITSALDEYKNASDESKKKASNLLDSISGFTYYGTEAKVNKSNVSSEVKRIQSETNEVIKALKTEHEKVQKEQEKLNKSRSSELQNSVQRQLNNNIDRYSTISKRMASGSALSTDAKELAKVKKEIETIQNSDILPADKLEASKDRIQQIDIAVDDLKKKLKEDTSDSAQSVIDKYQRQVNSSLKDSNTFKPSEGYKKAITNLQLSINELDKFKKKIADQPMLSEEDFTEFERLKKNVEDASQALKNFSSSAKGMKGVSIEKEISKINQTLNQNPRYSKAAKEALHELLQELESGVSTKGLDEIHQKLLQIQNDEEKAGRSGKGLIDVIKEKQWYGFAAQIAGMFSFYDVFNIAKQGFEVVKEFDSAFTEMRKVSNETQQSLKDYQATTFDVADTVGTTALQIQDSTADWMRLGESMEEAAQSAKDATILLNVSEFEGIDEATDSLVSMSQAYKDLDKMDIIDVLNNIGNNYSISTDGLATALKDSASSLVTANNDLNEAAALITAGNAITQDPSKTGAGIRTISLRLVGTEDAKQELEEMGESTDGMVTTVSKLRDIIKDATRDASKDGNGFDILDDNGNYKSTYEIMQGLADLYDDIVKKDKELGTNNLNLLLETIAGEILPEKYRNIFYRTYLIARAA